MKKCAKCGKMKPATDFYKTNRKNGLTARCKDCHCLTINSCKECGKKFEAKRNVKYCSDECRQKNARKQTFKVCEYCHKQFGPVDRLNVKYCSLACKHLASVGKPNKKKGKKYPHLQRARKGVCPVCKKTFRAVTDYKDRKQKYCSKECWENRGKTTYLYVCECCGVKFESRYDRPYKYRYCSQACKYKDMRGEKAGRYKDGKSLERDRARHSNDLKIWRAAVFKRDNYTCQECGGKGVIHAHHILTWAEHPTERFNLKNGVTLCISCHGKVHNKNFASKRKRNCDKCGKEISGKGATGLCRSCSIKQSWIKRWEDYTGNKAVLERDNK